MQVSFEFDMVMKTAGSKEKFDTKWELWCPAIIDYALATKNKSAALKCALRDIDMDLEGVYALYCCTSASIALCMFLCRKRVNHCFSLPWTLSAH